MKPDKLNDPDEGADIASCGHPLLGTTERLVGGYERKVHDPARCQDLETWHQDLETPRTAATRNNAKTGKGGQVTAITWAKRETPRLSTRRSPVSDTSCARVGRAS